MNITLTFQGLQEATDFLIDKSVENALKEKTDYVINSHGLFVIKHTKRYILLVYNKNPICVIDKKNRVLCVSYESTGNECVSWVDGYIDFMNNFFTAYDKVFYHSSR